MEKFVKHKFIFLILEKLEFEKINFFNKNDIMYDNDAKKLKDISNNITESMKNRIWSTFICTHIKHINNDFIFPFYININSDKYKEIFNKKMIYFRRPIMDINPYYKQTATYQYDTVEYFDEFLDDYKKGNFILKLIIN